MSSSRFVSTVLCGSLALMLAGCGLSQPSSLNPTRPVGGGGLQAKGLSQAPLKGENGPVTAIDALERAHEAAVQADPKAAFVSMLGQRIDAAGVPVSGGAWKVEYLGSPLPGNSNGNPYANKRLRRLVVTVDARGQLTVEASEQDGLPLGVCLLQHPMPALNSDEALRAAKRARPGELMVSVLEKMTLTSQMSPQHQPRLVWKLPTTQQGLARALILDANTGEIVTPAAH